MVQDDLLRVLLSVLFGGSGLFLLAQTIRAREPRARVDDGTHVLMCVSMLAMTFPWGDSWPVMPQLIVFGLAALWFVGQLFVAPLTGGAHRHGTGAVRLVALLYHAVMMAAMVWMVGLMSTLMNHSGSGGGEQDGRTGSAGTSMPGMSMPAHPAAGGFPHGLAVALGWVLVGVFAVATLVWSSGLISSGLRSAGLRSATATTGRVERPGRVGGGQERNSAVADSAVSTLDTAERARPLVLPALLAEIAMAAGMLIMTLVMIT